MTADPLTKSTVDNLFEFDLSDLDDDTFADKPTTKDTRDDKAVLSPRSGLKRKAGGDDKENDFLGLDQEVKIAKKRKPVAKLDEARLLSEPGIPKLRALARSKQLSRKLRFNGKGHEFTDAAKLLNHFQLWLDNLYPRAKFADALQLVEKVGHTKRMNLMRSEWINEGKPGYISSYSAEADSERRTNDPDLFGSSTTQADAGVGTIANANNAAGASDSLSGNGLDDDALFIPDANRPSLVDRDDDPEDDELDALLAAQNRREDVHPSTRQQQRAEDSEGEDDLDALLAEQDARQTQPPRNNPPTTAQHEDDEDEDEDDLDALLAEQETRNIQTAFDSTKLSSVQNGQPTPTIAATTSINIDSEDSEDEDDLSALLAMQRTRSNPKPNSDPNTKDDETTLPTPQRTSSPIRHDNSTNNRPSNSSPTHPQSSSTHHSETSTDTGTRAEAEAEMTTMFSSSPTPNNPEEVDLDDLDAMLASQEAKDARTYGNDKRSSDDDGEQRTPRANKVRAAEEDLLLLSSSPVPNEESQ